MADRDRLAVIPSAKAKGLERGMVRFSPLVLSDHDMGYIHLPQPRRVGLRRSQGDLRRTKTHIRKISRRLREKKA